MRYAHLGWIVFFVMSCHAQSIHQVNHRVDQVTKAQHRDQDAIEALEKTVKKLQAQVASITEKQDQLQTQTGTTLVHVQDQLKSLGSNVDVIQTQQYEERLSTRVVTQTGTELTLHAVTTTSSKALSTLAVGDIIGSWHWITPEQIIVITTAMDAIRVDIDHNGHMTRTKMPLHPSLAVAPQWREPQKRNPPRIEDPVEPPWKWTHPLLASTGTVWLAQCETLSSKSGDIKCVRWLYVPLKDGQATPIAKSPETVPFKPLRSAQVAPTHRIHTEMVDDKSLQHLQVSCAREGQAPQSLVTDMTNMLYEDPGKGNYGGQYMPVGIEWLTPRSSYFLITGKEKYTQGEPGSKRGNLFAACTKKPRAAFTYWTWGSNGFWAHGEKKLWVIRYLDQPVLEFTGSKVAFEPHTPTYPAQKKAS